MPCAAASSTSSRRARRRRSASISSATRWRRSGRSIRRPSAPPGRVARLDLVPASEAVLTEETIERFRQNYRAAFGAVLGNDPLYEAVSEGRRFAGMEHWLPFFYEKLETLFDYLPDAPVVVGHLVRGLPGDRLEQVRDHYEARREAAERSAAAGSVPYKPIPPEALYLSAGRMAARASPTAATRGSRPSSSRTKVRRRRSTWAAAPAAPSRRSARRATSTSSTRWSSMSGDLQKSGRKVLLASWSEGARDRLGQVLADHGLSDLKPVETGAALKALPDGEIGLAVLPLETGFEAPDLAVIGDQDVLGDRFVRTARRKRAADALTEVVEPRGRRPRRACRPRHRPLHGAEDHRGGGRAARLPGAAICRRRPAVPAGGEHRASLPLRRGGLGGRARPARRRRLAEPQGAAQEAHPRHGGAADQDRRRAADCGTRRCSRRPPASTTSSPPASPTRRRRTRTRRSTRRSTTSPPAGRWTG